MKKIFCLIVLLLFVSVSFLSADYKSKKVSYFSQGSFYFYGMGSFNHYMPSDGHYAELGIDSVNAFAPVLGLGYRVINSGNRFFLNIEGDYTPGVYDFRNVENQKISFMTLLVNGEFRLSGRKPISLFFGLGISLLTLRDMGYWNYRGSFISTGDYTMYPVAVQFGLKFPVSRNIMVRSEVRLYSKINATYDHYDDYYYDYEYWDDDTDAEPVATSVMLGLEIHL
ncbi:MAG: hypothetical protein GY757_06750 [bacterium]|nr:hypothetical protein [bacterium]